MAGLNPPNGRPTGTGRSNHIVVAEEDGAAANRDSQGETWELKG